VEANPAAPEALHALRIHGKRLRYAIEIFAGCFPPVLRENVYPLIERVQDTLGEVQDATVGAERLVGIRDRVQAVMPAELPRVRKGIDGLLTALKAKVPAGKKAFAAWRKEWLELMRALKLEALKATVIA
jgi:CHAD domain-containing protein